MRVWRYRHPCRKARGAQPAARRARKASRPRKLPAAAARRQVSAETRAFDRSAPSDRAMATSRSRPGVRRRQLRMETRALRRPHLQPRTRARAAFDRRARRSVAQRTWPAAGVAGVALRPVAAAAERVSPAPRASAVSLAARAADSAERRRAIALAYRSRVAVDRTTRARAFACSARRGARAREESIPLGLTCSLGDIGVNWTGL